MALVNYTGKTSSLAAARAILQSSQSIVSNSEKARNAIRADNIDKYQDVHNKLYQKKASTVKLQKLLEERIHGCKSALTASQASLKLCQDSSVAYDIRTKGIMEVKQARVEVWEKQGLGGEGATKDPSTAALEEEAAVLQNASAKIGEHIAHTKSMVQNLETLFQSLNSDLENKHHSLAIDEECMRTTHPTWPLPVMPPKEIGITNSNAGALKNPPAKSTPRKKSSINSVYSFSGPGGGTCRPLLKKDWRIDHSSAAVSAIRPDVTDAPDFEDPSAHAKLGLSDAVDEPRANMNSYQELTYQQETLRLVQRSRGAESTAQAMCLANKMLLTKLHETCQNASGFAEVALAKKIQCTQVEVKQLESTVEETSIALNKMLHCKALTADHLESHHEPARLFQHKVSLRQQRTPRECIGDPVQTAMVNHSKKLVENYQNLEECQRAEEEAIQQLQQVKTACEADLQHKKNLLEIEKRSLDHMSSVLTEVQKALNRIGEDSEDIP